MLNPSWMLGHAKTAFTHHKEPISLTLKTREGGKRDFGEFVKEATPPCRLNPLLFNGHLQTMYTAVKEAGPPIWYKRKTFESTFEVYPGQFTVDFVVPVPKPEEIVVDEELPERTTYYGEKEFEELESGNPEDDTPMLICLHGLSGGSHEVYLRHVVAPITAGGWECCVVNARGCANSKITTPFLFNARATWDVRQTIRWLRERYPKRPLYGIGFSLGANILTNYVAEEGVDCVLKAAIACSSPWNLEISHKNLIRTWVGLEVYSKVMGNNLKRLYRDHKEMVLQNPGITDEDVMACKYLYEFDRVVQTKTWGYPTEGAYYRDAASVDAVTAIRIPFLAISAEDDPISSVEAIPYEEFKQNPYTVLVTTNWGGHLSWFQPGGKRWFATAVASFLLKMQDEVDVNTLPKDEVNFPGVANSNKKYPVWDPSHRRMHFPL